MSVDVHKLHMLALELLDGANPPRDDVSVIGERQDERVTFFLFPREEVPRRFDAMAKACDAAHPEWAGEARALAARIRSRPCDVPVLYLEKGSYTLTFIVDYKGPPPVPAPGGDA